MNKLFFDHIPKVAGTSLVKVIEKFIGSADGHQSVNLGLYSALDAFRDSHFLHGHFYYKLGDSLPIDRFCMTMLRDPVDRVLSSYYFAKNNNSAKSAPLVRYAHQMELEEYIEYQDVQLQSEISNAQTKHFYPLCWAGGGSPSDQQMLSSAKLALEQFQLVGVLEDFESFLDILCFEQGWSPVTDSVRENTTLLRTKVSELPAPIRQRLEELNKLDIEFYQYACKLFNTHRRRIMLACIKQRSLGNQGVTASHATTAKTESLSSTQPVKQPSKDIDFGDHGAEIVSATVRGDLLGSIQILSGEMFVCKVVFKANEDIRDLTVGINIHNQNGLLVYGINSRLLGNKFSVAGGAAYFIEFVARCDLGIGNYTIGVALHPGNSHLQRCFHWREKVTKFEIIGHLGYHSDGLVKLYTQMRSGSLDPLNGVLLTEPAIEGDAGKNTIAHYTSVLTDFSATLKCLTAESIVVSVSETFEIEIEVCNTSQNKWPSIGLRQVNVSYHWLDSAGNLLEYDGKRTPLLYDVGPGNVIRMWASVIAPAQPGDALLKMTLVQEHVGWFDEHGSVPAVIEAMVLA